MPLAAEQGNGMNFAYQRKELRNITVEIIEQPVRYVLIRKKKK